MLDSIEFIHSCYERRERLDLSWDKKAWVHHAAGGGFQIRKPGKILVTGATGFIGGRIVEMAHLAPEARYPIRAGVHQWSSAARLGRFPVETAALDLMDPLQIERALEGVTHVIHCAKGSPEVTVQGTRNLLDASLKKGISHFIHLSTADVYGDAAGVVDENSPYHYTGNPYNRMKIDAEKICWEYREKGLPVTIFRPSIVYGPFSTSWSLRFAAMFLAGEGGIYEGYGEGRCNLVYVDDLARTILGALDFAGAQGKVFNINGPEIITWNEYFTRLNAALGLPPLRVIRAKRADAATWAMSPVRTLGGDREDAFHQTREADRRAGGCSRCPDTHGRAPREDHPFIRRAQALCQRHGVFGRPCQGNAFLLPGHGDRSGSGRHPRVGEIPGNGIMTRA